MDLLVVYVPILLVAHKYDALQYLVKEKVKFLLEIDEQGI